MELRRKHADSSAESAASPLPQVSVTPTQAPGLRGPKGLSPRQNYSRVNSGMPPQPDAGAVAQKTMSPMGITMLPAKVASEGSMGTIATTPTIQDMVKSAMAGAQTRARLAEEAAHQQSNLSDKIAEESARKEKTAGASDSVSTEYVEKLAAALEYATPFVKKAADLAGPYGLSSHEGGVGEGPGALKVMEAKASKPLPDHKGQGHTQIPTSTPLQPAVAGAKTQLENNAHHQTSGEMIQRNVGKTASVLAKLAKEDEKLEQAEGKGMAEAAKGLAKAEEAHSKEDKGDDEKKANATLVEAFLGHVKKAEDAINPAHISAGAAVPPDTSAAGESGGAPAGGQPQGPTGLVGSNEAAIKYNKNEAKAPVKTDMHKYHNEPALNGSTDTVLRDAFEHSSASDNNKMASANEVTKTAAARALLAKMAEAAQDKTAAKR